MGVETDKYENPRETWFFSRPWVLATLNIIGVGTWCAVLILACILQALGKLPH